MSLDDTEQPKVVSVDTETGEILGEQQRGTVINFRKAAAQ